MNWRSSTITRDATGRHGCPRRRGRSWSGTGRSLEDAGENVNNDLRPQYHSAVVLETPAPNTVHLICVDPPYYNNVQYAELSNFFYVWLKRALGDYPGL